MGPSWVPIDISNFFDPPTHVGFGCVTEKTVKSSFLAVFAVETTPLSGGFLLLCLKDKSADQDDEGVLIIQLVALMKNLIFQCTCTTNHIDG